MRLSPALLVVIAAAALGQSTKPQETQLPFRDTFQGKLAPGWKWIREDPKHWRVGEHGLEVHIQPGNMWGPANDAKNVLVRPAPDPQKQPVEITASIRNHPTSQYEQVDLVWYYTDSDMVKIDQEMVNGKVSVVMGREQNDKTRTIAIIPIDSDSVELRLIVRDKQIQGKFKLPKGEWRTAGECDLPAKGPPLISLQFYQGPPHEEHWARVSELTVQRAE